MLFRAYVERRRAYFLLFIAILLFAPQSIYAASCAVPSTAYPTIQTAVDASECTRVLLEVGTFDEQVVISRTVNVIGAGEQESVIDGGGTGTAVIVQPGLKVKLENLVIQNGNAAMGGGIFNDGSQLRLIRVLLKSNTNPATQLSHGGAIYNNMGSILLKESVVQENGKLADVGGGIYNNLGVLTIKDSQLLDNGFPTSTGGTIHNEQGTVVIRRSLFFEGFAVSGGILYNNGGYVNSKQSEYNAGNGVRGAAVYNNGAAEFRSNGDMFVSNFVIGVGGAIFNDGGTIHLKNCLFDGNTSFSDGGAIHNSAGTMTLVKCSLQNNVANGGRGGAIFNNDMLDVRKTEIVGNTADFGGGITNFGTLSLKKMTFAENVALVDGDDVWNSGTCTGCVP
ncbi:MAG: hypothetical protein AAF614_05490 [Chloroflexota bacterium]